MKDGKWQHGDLGPDGLRFDSYRKDFRNGERWLDEDKFLMRDAFNRLNARMRLEDGSERRSSAAYRAANPEKESATRAAYYAANKEKVKTRVAAWNAANLDKRNAQSAKRRAAERDATVESADHGIIATFYSTAKRLSNVTGIPFEVDHIIPLVANGGGGKHHHANLRVLPQSINLRRNSPSYVEPSCWAVPFPSA